MRIVSVRPIRFAAARFARPTLIRSCACLLALSSTVSHAGDIITEWNLAARNAASAAGGNAGNAANAITREVAIASLAVNDAVVSITKTSSAYFGKINSSGPASVDAAAAKAAHDVLVQYFPSQAATFDTQLTNDLNAIADGAAKTNGIFIGQASAQQAIAARANDGSNGSTTFYGNNGIGEWRTNTPGVSASQPYWGHVTPFALTSANQFAPGAPPALTSAQFAAAYQEVKDYGALNSTVRTADQTQVAQFWYSASTINWNDITRAIVQNHSLSLSEEARAFALVNIALADSRVAAWNAKFDDGYNLWRPITGIQNGNSDGNNATVGDPNWQPLLPTPNHPSYVSGHSTSGGAAAAVLESLFGNNQSFSITSVSTYLPGSPDTISRSYTSISQAADENDDSRVWAGVHWRFDDTVGRAVGEQVGNFVVANELPTVPEPSTFVIWSVLFGTLAAFNRRDVVRSRSRFRSIK